MEDGTIAGQEVSLSARRAWIEIQAEREIKKLLDESLSARRAWIEIAAPACCEPAAHVALRKESVDRNTNAVGVAVPHLVALRKESVDRNLPQQPGKHL